MSSINQNNKIAIAATAIFFASFCAMIFWFDSGDTSPDYVKSDVLEAAIGGEGGGHGGGHSPYFSETEEATETTETDASHGEVASSHEEDSGLENMYRVLVGNLDKPYFVLQPEGKIKYLSEDFISEYGYEVSDYESFFSLLNAEDLPDFVTEYTQVIHTGKSRQGIGPYRLETTASGSFVHLVNLIPVVNDLGSVTEVIGVIKDITEKVENFGGTVEAEVEEHAKEDGDSKHTELWYKSLIGVNFS